MQEVCNFYLAISLEGFEGVNDLRRGEGVYGRVMKAMDLGFLRWIFKMMESLLADVLQEEEIIFILMRMVKETRAKSTDLQSSETVEHLCGKCSEYAKEWAGVADKIWKETDYKKPSYENYKK